ncbi:hypothetical protein B0H11DRAFT_2205294, partial [Mycena galericulata]
MPPENDLSNLIHRAVALNLRLPSAGGMHIIFGRPRCMRSRRARGRRERTLSRTRTAAQTALPCSLAKQDVYSFR